MARGALVLDAAMGTRLIAMGLDLSDDDPALWNLSHPEAVRELHARDVAAGSDAVVTNTFGANRHWLTRYGRAGDVAAINRRAVELARDAAGPGRFVFGSIGPTASGVSDASREQAEALAVSGVDALLFETHTRERAERALEQVGGTVSLPLMVCLLDWPPSPAEPARRLAVLGATALGANCQHGMEPALRLAEALHRVTDLPLIFKPGAGLPGEPPASPDSFAQAVHELESLGARLIGGCCGTTEAHVAALRSACPPWNARHHFAADGPPVRRGPTP